MTEGSWDFEARIRAALVPVEPPAELELRLEDTLDSLVEMAADELETWELSAMKDPRNWPRAALGPAAAIVVGGGAAAGLVLLRTQRKSRRRGAFSLRRTMRDTAREALRVFDDIAR
jgi:hypothetical protein